MRCGGRPWLAVVLGLALAAGGDGPASAAAGFSLVEPPFLVPQVQAGVLPPVTARLPQNPSVVELSGKRSMGRYGGALRLLLARPKDVRMLVVYGYARLVAWTPDFRLVPDIAESVEVQQGRRFTIRLRAGHRWSDGAPFTAEDFRYWWEDVANNPMLSPTGPPSEMLVHGKPPRFEVVDARTVRFTWDEPNPDFLPALAGASPLYIYRPAHYLKRFHARYADPERLARRVSRAGARNWAALHNRRDDQYRNDNPRLPTLQPWVARTRPPAQRFVFTRNPYFHRVDAAGRQLPYIDHVIVTIADPKILPAKTATGESDLQARGLHFSDYTFLKRGEKSHGYNVRLWRTAKGAHIALFPNLNTNDPVWRKLFRDVRVRRALSLAIDRHEINQVVYFGLAREGANTVLAESPLYRDRYRRAWATFDPDRARALLDAAGLDRRDARGVRLLPDGRPAELVVETAGEDTEQTDVLELIRDGWRRVGIRTHVRPSQREVFRNRIFAGETLISVWSGYENGLATAQMSPAEFAPTSQQQLQWPRWGQHFQTGGMTGEPPADPAAQQLLRLYRAWRAAPTVPERERIWHRMLEINADQVFSIGIVAAVPQPVVVSTRLRNVPADGVYNWDPGAFFGVYRPDTFWIARPDTAASSNEGAGRRAQGKR